MKFTEESLENAIIELFANNGINHIKGDKLKRELNEVLIEEDIVFFLKNKYGDLSDSEIESLINDLKFKSSSDLFESNKYIQSIISEGVILKRENDDQKDLLIKFIDFKNPDQNNFKIINQLEIIGYEKRIPDCILYVNGFPLVIFEFKSAIKEDCTIYDAYIQLKIRYQRDIPDIFKYNSFCVISDGVNSKMGSIFSDYEYFYSWRKVTGLEEKESIGIDTLFSLINGAFNKTRFCQIIENFIYFSDVSKNEEKVLCRYPQFYASLKLFNSILLNKKPNGDGKGGTYFGATGCGKSFTMLFLTRLLMRSNLLASPTIILITDRTDLDDQLSELFENSKKFIGDDVVFSVNSRLELRQTLKERNSGGVFLTTIQKFNEDINLLSNRDNIICISDEAHRTQVNLDLKIETTQNELIEKYGFAKHLHNSLPNATYVGFTGTPIDQTLNVFGNIVDSYTMKESVDDNITVKIVYEGRAAKVFANNEKLKEVEKYYDSCAEEGASEYAIEESKKTMSKMDLILGNEERLNNLAHDFINHYEKRIEESPSNPGKAMFVCSSRMIAFDFYKEIISLRPEWKEIKTQNNLDSNEDEPQPIEKIKMVMTRDKNDPKELWQSLGDKKYRKFLDKEFKKEKSNFKIAIVVDMWLTGFDVPSLDVIYIDKPIKRHNLIQAISRVNRTFPGKSKGLVVDYIGIKKQMRLALAKYSNPDQENLEDIKKTLLIIRSHLEILTKIFYNFDKSKYFHGSPLEKLICLKQATEFIQTSTKLERQFMKLVQELKLAFTICSGSEDLTNDERNQIYFYISIRSIIFKLIKPNSPDTAEMNLKVSSLVKEALESDGVEQIFQIGSENTSIDIFDDSHIDIIDRIKLPNTKFKLLQMLIMRQVSEFKKINKIKSAEFSDKIIKLVDKYNDRKEQDVFQSEVINDFSDQILKIYEDLKNESQEFIKLGIDIEEKAFFDILLSLTKKYQFEYPKNKMIELSKEVKKLVTEKSQYTDWLNRGDIKAELKAELVLLLSKFGYPPITHDDAYKEIFDQASSYRKFKTA